MLNTTPKLALKHRCKSNGIYESPEEFPFI
jgi:hypothetical protein